ncbi:GLPGLI family protein [Pedobacter flavus]|uniref:GLPGLI family protein n=1 Tax=Pedobacter flavus TaxID=3113906 RepID=A0ABU7H3N9_9SPHI|nr:GLPGLI family protein [Pedobacter sp. VNH31]MEE1885869.1 GLPGLI family protein [Pedobacter sp. VNH31]
MKRILIICIALFVVQKGTAQESFNSRGKITFEKSVNQKRVLDDSDWFPSEYKDRISTYKKSNWEYQFNDTHALYKEGEKNAVSNEFMFYTSGGNGQFYTQFKDGKRIFVKDISSVPYLLTDTIPKLDWKILPEIRMIAGYETRKATAVFNDTVTVVAFYTDQILTQGGPEGFTGLPGMILGLAIPRYFTTWFATKIEILPETALKIQPPTKGQKVDNEKDYAKMLDIFLRWTDDKVKPSPEEIRRRIYSFTL